MLPGLVIQKLGFITIENSNSSRINPSQNDILADNKNEMKKRDHDDGKPPTSRSHGKELISSSFYSFYNAPIVKFSFYLVRLFLYYNMFK